MKKETHSLTMQNIRGYLAELTEQERSAATVQKYAHDLTAFLSIWPESRLRKPR